MAAPALYRPSNGLYVPLRGQPDRVDNLDPERIDFVMKRWRAQDNAYMGFSKTVEEHIRMLSGRQWDRWSPVYGRFVDVLQFMSEDERRYRMRPVMDYLSYWFVLTLAKAIENQTVMSFQPATSDRIDAMLAEVLDPVWKTLWHDMQMDSRRAKLAGWLLTAGEAYYHTRADFTVGPKRKLIQPAELTLDRGPGVDPIRRMIDRVPFDAQGNPLAKLVPMSDDPEDVGYEVTGEPYEDLEGGLAVDVLCPLQVRAQWGQHIPWRDKRWIAMESFLSPDQVFEQTGVYCDPDHYIGNDEASPGYLERMLFGEGYFGPTSELAGMLGATESTDTDAKRAEGFVRVITWWEKPVRGFTDPTDENPGGGRLLIVAPGVNKVLWDSVRPFKTACAGPIRRAAFIDMPGRAFGTTLLERAVPMQRRYNRIEAHIAQHTNLCADPILMIHEATGVDEDEFQAKPGLKITHGYNGPGQPAYFLAPPPLSPDVWKHKNDVREQMFVVLSMTGNQSQAPTANASGDLVEQLRTNADRPLTPLTMSMAIAECEVAEDALAILPAVWTEEKLISLAGADNVVRTVKVTPEMLEGTINVRPNLESASAEGKGAKRSRIIQLFQLGAFGDLTNPAQRPKAVQQLLDLLNFPDLNRASRPGGVDRVMAEHNVGRLVRGDTAAEIPLLEVYDLAVHLDVVETEMKAPEYLRFDMAIQQEFVVLRQMIMSAQEVKAISTISRSLPVAQATAAAQGAVASTAKLATEGPPADAPAENGAGSPPGAATPSPAAA